MKLSLDASARNALTLVSQRYGIRRERIVALAPLLFFIAAEKSLRERQERVDQLIAAADDLVDLQKQIRHLPLHAPLDDNAVGSEQDSITARDLFAERVLDEPDLFTSLDRNFEEASDNPFVAHLKRALELVGASDDEVSSVWWHPHSWPKYEICSDQAEQIVGSNAGAVNAILLGAAALHEMPKAAREERAAWAIGEYRRKFGDLDDSIEDLLSSGVGRQSQGRRWVKQ